MTRREILEHSLAELQAQVDKHQKLMRTAFEGESVDCHCLWSDCQHQHTLISVIAETVQVLDETRKAFKSKQLEQLRTRLMRLLGERATNRSVLQHLTLDS